MNAPANLQFDDPKTLVWWNRALRGERGPITADEPMTGYYRARSLNKQTGEEKLYAVAYWWHQGRCFCKVNGGETLTGEKYEKMLASWPHVSKEPIKFDVYQAVIKGQPWPDQHVAPKAAAAEASTPLDAQSPTTATPTAAAAEPVDETPQGHLRRNLNALKAGASRYQKIESEDMAAACGDLIGQLSKIHTKAKKVREDANRPHKDVIDANNAIWKPIEDEAEATYKSLKKGPIAVWEKFKRDQADAAAKASQAANAPIASNAPAPASKIKPATGRALSVQETKKAVIADYDAVYAHFKDDLQVKAILQGLANAAVRAGIEVPGTTTEKDVDIR